MSAENADRERKARNKDLVNGIQQLRRKFADIVQPYTRPISSILPEERRVEASLLFDEIGIEAHYDRFKQWEGSMSKKKIRDWLTQFESTLDQNIAHLLLSHFQFFSKSDIEVACRRLQDKMLDSLVDKETLRQAFHSASKPHKKTEANFREWLRNKIIRYARLPSPADTSVESQDRLWGVYERAALTATSAPSGKKLRPLQEYFEASSGEPETSAFVFMDYTNGSGEQLRKCLREINKLLNNYPKWQNSIFVFMYVVQSESFRLEEIKLRPQNSETLYYAPMLDYKSTEIMEMLGQDKITEAEYDEFIEKYCLRASGKTALGYRQSASLTCHHYSCPNNTLPFFHSSNNDWLPLFPKSQTPGGANYKRK